LEYNNCLSHSNIKEVESIDKLIYHKLQQYHPFKIGGASNSTLIERSLRFRSSFALFIHSGSGESVPEVWEEGDSGESFASPTAFPKLNLGITGDFLLHQSLLNVILP
jgi:hypothetical protein